VLHYWWITNKENRNLGPQVPIEGHHQTAATGRERGETGPNFCVEHRPPFSFRESGTVEKIQNNYQTCKLCVHYKNRERKALLVRHISVVCTEKSRTPFQLDKLPSVEDRGHADRVTVLANPCPWPMILTFNPPRAAIMTHTRAKKSRSRCWSGNKSGQTYGRTRTIWLYVFRHRRR